MQMTHLLRVPLGPYPEDLILSEECKSQPRGNLVLNTLKMECGGSPIGLDECEFVAAALSDSRVVQHSDSFYFYGILEIKTLGWLSPQGKKILQDDLQRLGYPLDLATRYRNPRFKVSVWIQCVKNMPVRFLSANGYETALVINSKKRTYSVTSLDAGTFQSSRNFLTRYRLWALLDDLIIQSGTPPTRIEERTIDWLVKQYLHRLQRKSNGRFARHVSRAEIIGMFAAHADWILAQHLASPAKNVQKVNLPKWIRFCTEVAAARLSARRACNSQGWGLPEGRATNETILDLSRFGKAPVEWKKLIDNALKREKANRLPLMNKSYPAATIATTATIKDPSAAAEFAYDSDFSEASTSEYSDSDDDNLVVAFPSAFGFCLRRPVISDGQFEWQCAACNYTIDLLDLTKENTRTLSPADEKWLRSRAWKSSKDEVVQRMLYEMVNDHFTAHDDRKLHRTAPKVATRDTSNSIKVETID